MPRLRELGISIGELAVGRLNAITDVTSVRVGHTTLISGEGALRPGRGPVRTGVTVILPHEGNLYEEKVTAAVHTINGFGKVAGFEQVRELGNLEAPLALTNTLNVGLVLDALVQYMLRQNPQIGITGHSGSVNIVVGETNDSFLNDIQGRHVRARHVWAAIEGAAAGPVSEGAVGAGTGTVCYGWKGGIGTSSRVLPVEAGGYTLGALVQSNFGARRDLLIAGAPVGRWLPAPDDMPQPGPGSIMIVLATDAPLSSRQLQRLCARAAAGLARTGGYLQHGSGDFVIAFSTARRIAQHSSGLTTAQVVLADEGRVMNALFRAVVESVEEAVLNSLTSSQTVTGRDGHMAHALPLEQVQEMLASWPGAH
jgi:D-aminopeptidase